MPKTHEQRPDVGSSVDIAGGAHAPSTRELLRAFGRVGCLGFGGPAGQAALLQRVVVDERRWLDARSFADGLALCAVLPGPEAMQLATWTGWRVAGARGAAIAATLFVLPGAACVWVAAATWNLWSTGSLGASVAEGLRCAVVCLLVASLVQLARTLASGTRERVLALAAAGLALSPLAGVPVALALGAVGGLGLLRGQRRTAISAPPLASSGDEPPHAARRANTSVRDCAPDARRSDPAIPRESAHASTSAPRVPAPPWWGLLLLAVAWLAPLWCLAAWHGGRAVELARELGALAIFGFGGAYTMVAWFGGAVVAQGLAEPSLVAEALGVAEATPGPLVLATQFLSHHALASEPGASSPLLAGTLGAFVAVWSIFPPSALWVLAAAGPYERVRQAPLIAPLFAGVRCASLGVLFALGVQLAEATLWHDANAARPLDVGALATCVVLGGCMAWKRIAVPVVLGAGIALRVACASLLGL